MIFYNFCYRGKYDYDKFILNIMQLHNDVLYLQDKIFTDNAKDTAKLLKTKAEFDELFNSITDNPRSQQLHVVSFYFK